MKLLSLWIPEANIGILDQLVKNGFYLNRSEAIRLAVRDLVVTEQLLLSKRPHIKNPKLWKNNKTCPNCGAPANPYICACETGYDYCSDDCAREHVNALEPEAGW